MFEPTRRGSDCENDIVKIGPVRSDRENGNELMELIWLTEMGYIS